MSMMATITVVLLLLAAAWAVRARPSETRRVANSRASRSNGGKQDLSEREMSWDRGDEQAPTAPPPPSSYQLPPIPESRGVWHKARETFESWGFVTERNAQEVGVDVLSHYERLDGWQLAQSEPLGLFADCWGCTVYRRQTKEVVMVMALPEHLGETPGGKANLTRVSVVRMAGEEALRDVLGQGHFDGGK